LHFNQLKGVKASRRLHQQNKDLERIYTRAQFVGKLRRVAEAIESNRSISIQIAGERIFIPKDAIFNIEHERDVSGEEIEFQFKWKRTGKSKK